MIAEVVAVMFAGQSPVQGYCFITRFGERVGADERPRKWAKTLNDV
jgi:hypothetical protein